MNRMFGKKPKPKQESVSSRPEAFFWADQINKTEPGSDERWRVWRQAYRRGIVLDVNPDLKCPDFYPEEALDDYLSNLE